MTYSPSNISQEGIRVLRSSNINEEYFVISEDDVFVKQECVNIPFCKNGDILITAANGSSKLVGKHAVLQGLSENKAVHGGFMILGESNNSTFINASMSSSWYVKFINLHVAGGNGAIGNLNKNDLENQRVLFPTTEEQTKIGELFDNLDHLITLHQRKVFNYHMNFQLILIDLFYSWEQCELWEVTIWDKKFNEVESSKQPKTIKYPYVLADSLNNLEELNGDVLLLSTGTYVGYTTKEKAGSNLCYGEIVAIPWGGVANIKYCSGFFVTADNRIATSNDKDILDNRFLYWWMESNLISIQNTYRGASIKHPSMNYVLSLKISFPSIEEQNVISNYLDQVNNLITLHQRKGFFLKQEQKVFCVIKSLFWYKKFIVQNHPIKQH